MKKFFMLLATLLPMAGFASDGHTVSIVFNGSDAHVNIPAEVTGVTCSNNGAYVTINSTNTTDEYTYEVSGSTTDGGLTIVGSYKMTLVLAGVSIESQRGYAIDVECGKRIAVVLASGTVNNIIDMTGGSQKAAMYFKGHPEFEGNGVLNVTGRAKHAISAKEYLQIKKSAGTINILGAISDGIHCGKGAADPENNYFQINGGTVNISNVGGDAIDSDDYGSMFLKGGRINISLDATDVQGLKCDSVLHMSGGEVYIDVNGQDADGIRACYAAHFDGGYVNINAKGDGAKAIKTKNGTKTVLNGGSAYFNGTDFDITLSGGDYIDASGEVTKCMAISVDKDMEQTDGIITIGIQNAEAKPYNVKGTMTSTGGQLVLMGSRYAVDVNKYQYDMTCYAELLSNGQLLDSYNGMSVAAFVGDECRGVGEVVAVQGNFYIYLRVYSNAANGEKVSFRVYDAALEQEYTCLETAEFSKDATIGMPSTPLQLNYVTRQRVPGDANNDGVVSVADLTLIANYVLGGTADINLDNADVNADGVVSVADITLVANMILNK